MPTITSALRYALSAAALVAAARTAEARPRRVVVVDFDGPRQLADTGRSSVLSVLSGQYEVVSPLRWKQAREDAAQQAHGPAQWSRAAKQSGVDAVIEGYVQEEGRHKMLHVTVREADNGREVDTITVRLDGRSGVAGNGSGALRGKLDEVLDWIDPGQGDPPPGLPIIDAKKLGPSRAPADDPAPAPSRRGRRAAAAQVDDDATAGDPAAGPAQSDAAAPDAPAGRRRWRRGAPGSVAASDGSVSVAVDDGGAAPARAQADATVAAAPAPAAESHDGKPVEVSTADRESHEIEVLFPPGTEERRDVLGPKADHVPRPTTRFMIDGGGYMGSRSLLWNAVDSENPPTQFAGVSSKGLQLNASVYPFPSKAIDGVMSGIGFTASLSKSLGSTVEIDDTQTVSEYVINETSWELGVHYRLPLSSLVTVDGGVFYGNQTYEIEDAPAPPDFDVPDTKYSYLGVGAHLDLAVTDRASVGFGARYFTVLDTGDLSSVMAYGPVSASGLGLEGSFLIPLPQNLYVRGELSYQRISLETSGVGELTEASGVTDGTDSIVKGSVNVGIAF